MSEDTVSFRQYQPTASASDTPVQGGVTPHEDCRQLLQTTGTALWGELYTKNHPRPSAQAEHGATQRSPDKTVEKAETLFDDLAKIQEKRETTKKWGFRVAKTFAFTLIGLPVAAAIWGITRACLNRTKCSKETIEKTQKQSELSTLLGAAGKKDSKIEAQVRMYGMDRVQDLSKECNGLKAKVPANKKKIEKFQSNIRELLNKSNQHFASGNMAKGAMYLKRADAMLEQAKGLSNDIPKRVEDRASRITQTNMTIERERYELSADLEDLKEAGLGEQHLVAIKGLLDFIKTDASKINKMKLRTKDGIAESACADAEKRLEETGGKLELAKSIIERLKQNATNEREVIKIASQLEKSDIYKQGSLEGKLNEAQNLSYRLELTLRDDEALPHLRPSEVADLSRRLTEIKPRLEALEEAIKGKNYGEATKQEAIEINLELRDIEEAMTAKATSDGGGLGDNDAAAECGAWCVLACLWAAIRCLAGR
jgi:hypothetical protein